MTLPAWSTSSRTSMRPSSGGSRRISKRFKPSCARDDDLDRETRDRHRIVRRGVETQRHMRQRCGQRGRQRETERHHRRVVREARGRRRRGLRCCGIRARVGRRGARRGHGLGWCVRLRCRFRLRFGCSVGSGGAIARGRLRLERCTGGAAMLIGATGLGLCSPGLSSPSLGSSALSSPEPGLPLSDLASALGSVDGVGRGCVGDLLRHEPSAPRWLARPARRRHRGFACPCRRATRGTGVLRRRQARESRAWEPIRPAQCRHRWFARSTGAGAAGTGAATATAAGAETSAGFVSAVTAGASSLSFAGSAATAVASVDVGRRRRDVASSATIARRPRRRPIGDGSAPARSRFRARPVVAAGSPEFGGGHSWPAACLGHPRASPVGSAVLRRLGFGGALGARFRLFLRRASLAARRATRAADAARRPASVRASRRTTRPARWRAYAPRTARGARAAARSVPTQQSARHHLKRREKPSRGLQAPGQPCSGRSSMKINGLTTRSRAPARRRLPASPCSRPARTAAALRCAGDHCAASTRLIGIAACSTASTRKAVRRTRASSSPCPAASIPRSRPRCSRPRATTSSA